MNKASITILTIFIVFSSNLIVSANVINIDEIKADYNIKSQWKQINKDGFGDKYNIATRGIEVFQDCLVIGTWNFKDLGLFDGPLNKILLEILKSGKIPFGNELAKIFESNGCEIWGYNGENIFPIVASNGTMTPGFGNINNLECSVLRIFNNYLYAFIWNSKDGFEIWRTYNLNNKWESVVKGGLLDNPGVMVAESFKGDLYIGTMNFEKGTEIFRSSDGENWEVVVGGDSKTPSGFGTKDNYYAHSMMVYNSYLYVGTNTGKGCEIWRTQDGVNWEPVIAYNKKKAEELGLAYSKGFGKGKYIDGIRTMIVYNEELYCGSTRPSHYRLIVKNRFSRNIFSIKLSRPRGAQIWKYNEESNIWVRVVGGFGIKSWCNGFGDSKNIQIWSIEIFNESLYVGTLHADSGEYILRRNRLLGWDIMLGKLKGSAELWSYDGTKWEQVVGDEAHQKDNVNPPNGFGDNYNWGFRTMKVYKNNLYVGTINFETGCELWKYYN